MTSDVLGTDVVRVDHAIGTSSVDHSRPVTRTTDKVTSADLTTCFLIDTATIQRVRASVAAAPGGAADAAVVRQVEPYVGAGITVKASAIGHEVGVALTLPALGMGGVGTGALTTIARGVRVGVARANSTAPRVHRRPALATHVASIGGDQLCPGRGVVIDVVVVSDRDRAGGRRTGLA